MKQVRRNTSKLSLQMPSFCSPLLPSRCSGTAKRSASQPLGQEQYKSVWTGNVLCARALVVLLIASSLKCWWILEQPRGSWMEEHPAFQEVLHMVHVFRHSLSMGRYGSKTEKPTWLYSSLLDGDSTNPKEVPRSSRFIHTESRELCSFSPSIHVATSYEWC